MADIYEITVDTTGMGQTTPDTCWLACYKMLHKSAGLPDGGIASNMRNANLPYDDYYYNGLPKDKYPSARDSLKLQSYSATYIKGAADSPTDFISFLKSHGTIWCSIERNKKLHVILVNGYDGNLKQVRAINPWSNIAAGTIEKMYIPTGDFKTWVTSETASCQVHPSWKPIPFDPSST